MEPSLLMWGISTFITVSGHMTGLFFSADLCDDNPPSLKHAAYKALEYRTGTMLNCGCERGFRRLNSVMRCAGNSSHASWENKCQCVSTSSKRTERQVTPKPEEEKAMQSLTLPGDQGNLPGHCREPPSWDHEDSERIYHFVVGQTVHYQCAPGFRALRRGSAESVCKTVSGKTQWTRPQLKCISDREDGQFPADDEEEPEASTLAPPGRDTSRPLMTAGTTDSHKHTEVATTMESFLFTSEYQIAVAGCVLLPVSVLLLSGLTWQRRWRKRRRTI
ncbi:interleukin-2 receptor subunit alpha isoform X1 [Lontra canadensis]|uniref:interleukin-2 receptor subunit alpha isoform X1 n=1 Tax=Lontra canadensis TaxID=76717 RepID=UPI0013F2E823|nr:interleukin-2 receptor subunit alpha isoform X1 [Lontra canadensis]